MAASNGGGTTTATLVVRFRDNEIVEGVVSTLDFDKPDLQLMMPDGTSNNRTVIVPLTAVKLVVLERQEFCAEPDGARLRKAAIRFWDGDVLKGFVTGEPSRHDHAMTVQMVSPTMDEVELFAIPYTAIKALFFLKAWDGRPPSYERESKHWSLAQRDTPLLDLLGEIRGLSSLRVRGQITDVEFERRRRAVLDRI
jgi:hypothetical protein